MPVKWSGEQEIEFTVGNVVPEKSSLTSWYDLAVVSLEDDGVIELELGYATEGRMAETAQALLTHLVDTIRIVGTAGFEVSESTLSKASAVFTTPSAPTNGINTDQGVEASFVLLENLWFFSFAKRSQVKQSSFDGPLREDARTLPFYEIGGDLLDAADLVTNLAQRRNTARKRLEKGTELGVFY